MRTHLILAKRLRSWTVKKAKCWRIDAFELWCWRRLLRVPRTERRFNQSILKEISPKYSLEGLMLKLKLQYFGHLMQRTDSLEKILDAGKDWRQEEKGMSKDGDGSVASLTQWTWVWVSSGSWWWTGKPGKLQSMGSQRVRHDNHWTEPWEELLQGRDHSFSLSPRIKTMWGRPMQYPRDRSKPPWCRVVISA